jgi:hypothetical protein
VDTAEQLDARTTLLNVEPCTHARRWFRLHENLKKKKKKRKKGSHCLNCILLPWLLKTQLVLKIFRSSFCSPWLAWIAVASGQVEAGNAELVTCSEKKNSSSIRVLFMAKPSFSSHHWSRKHLFVDEIIIVDDEGAKIN